MEDYSELFKFETEEQVNGDLWDIENSARKKLWEEFSATVSVEGVQSLKI